MKTVLLPTTLLLSCLTGIAQEKNPESITSGKVTFEEKIKIEIKLEGDAAQFAGMLPKERKTEKILSFTKDATLFEDGASMDEEMASDESDGTVKIRMMGSAENKIFTDLKDKKVIEQRDFMNRIFLVEKEMPSTSWKITGNQKNILGFTCMEAVKSDTTGNKIVAWFTPAININGGPSGLGNLPGMILEADFDGGQRTYTAKAIEPDTSGELRLKKPRDGKPVSESEFKAIVEAKMKEMGVEPGSGSGQGTHMQIVIKQQ
jgi:GLPGLI family protein